MSHPASTQITPASHPVFFDPTGKRWKRIVIASILAIIAFTAMALILTPPALAPAWPQPLQQDASYPRQLLSSGDVESIPLLGEENGFSFNRMALVTRTDKGVFLKDPFSDRIFRKATDQEVVEIGSHEYVMDQFGAPADKQLMLTFDDGPDVHFTTELLDLLSREGVPATFFVVGQNAVKYPEVLQRIVREGHMVANHTLTHADFYQNSDIINREELIGTDRIIRAAADYASPLFRIPKGDPHNNPLPLLQGQQLGYLHVNMDIDTRDWAYEPGEHIPVPELDGKGHVVLLHDGGGDREATIKLVEELIAQAKSQGYTFATLAPILPDEYLPDTDITPAVSDRVTMNSFNILMVLPQKIVGWLFWFGVVSLSAFSLLYITLATISHRRYQRRLNRKATLSNWPFVSVILPVFNEEPVIRKTLDALRASDYPNFEVIAINDGSTDGTLDVLIDYARSWPNLVVINQANSGKSAASNNGIAHAKGTIIVTLDGDTVFEPHTIHMLARHFISPSHNKRVKPIGAVAGHVKVGNRRNILTAWQSLEYISGICVTRMAEGLMGAISIVPGACAAWRKDAIVAAGGYSHDTLAEDADLTLTLHQLGYRIVQENQAVAWTEAPATVRSLAKQRLRWTYGNLQALRKHSSMLLKPRFGFLGMVTMPYTLLSIVVPLLFMPLTIAVAVLSTASGNWQPVALFAAFVSAAHLIISSLALWMVKEKAWHLLVVPIYRVIYEPLRVYLLYASLLKALKGRLVGWYRPERIGSVNLPTVTVN